MENTDQTIIQYDGSQQFKAILINCDHKDFVKCRIDSASLAFFTENISKIPDSLIRMVAWFYINERVRDQLMKVIDHRNMVLNQLPFETDDTIVQYLLGFLN